MSDGHRYKGTYGPYGAISRESNCISCPEHACAGLRDSIWVAVALGAFALVSDKVLRLAGGGVKMAMLELAESNGYELPAAKEIS